MHKNAIRDVNRLQQELAELHEQHNMPRSSLSGVQNNNDALQKMLATELGAERDKVTRLMEELAAERDKVARLKSRKSPDTKSVLTDDSSKADGEIKALDEKLNVERTKRLSAEREVDSLKEVLESRKSPDAKSVVSPRGVAKPGVEIKALEDKLSVERTQRLSLQQQVESLKEQVKSPKTSGTGGNRRISVSPRGSSKPVVDIKNLEDKLTLERSKRIAAEETVVSLKEQLSRRKPSASPSASASQPSGSATRPAFSKSKSLFLTRRK